MRTGPVGPDVRGGAVPRLLPPHKPRYIKWPL